MTPRARRAASDQLERDSGLRIAFAGGCGAFGYRISAARKAYPGDHIFEVDGLRLFLDARAAQELVGAEIDFDDDSGFAIDHPLTGRSC